MDEAGTREGFSQRLAQSSVDPEAMERLNKDIDFDSLENYEFGGKLAAQIGADMSMDDKERSRSAEEIERDAKREAAARPQDWRAKVAGMSHEERVQATLECLERKNNQKEIKYDLLEFCKQERTEDEVEEFLTNHKQFADGYHTASKYLLFFTRTGGIDELEYTEDGELITDEMRQALAEQAAAEGDEPAEQPEDPAAEWHYLTTAAGIEAMERFDPVARTQAMLSSQKTSRHASFKRLLEFCATPRSLKEITDFMAGDPGLEINAQTGVMGMQPSAYIGKLDEAGALTWNGGWQTTQGGLGVLKTLQLD